MVDLVVDTGLEGAIRKLLEDRFHPVGRFYREGKPMPGWTGPIDVYAAGPVTSRENGWPLTREQKRIIMQLELGEYKYWLYRLWYGWHYYEDEEDGVTRICVHYTYTPLGPALAPTPLATESITVEGRRKDDATQEEEGA